MLDRSARIEASATSPQRLIAHHCTRYLGDLAGGQVIAAMMRRHDGVEPEALTFYDFTALGDTMHYRRRYKALLDRVPWSPAEQAEFIAECRVAFAWNTEVFGQLGEHVGAAIDATASPLQARGAVTARIGLRTPPRPMPGPGAPARSGRTARARAGRPARRPSAVAGHRGAAPARGCAAPRARTPSARP